MDSTVLIVLQRLAAIYEVVEFLVMMYVIKLLKGKIISNIFRF